MKKNKVARKVGGLLVLGTLVLSSGLMAFADYTYPTPAQIYSKLTNTTVEEAYNAKGDKTFGQLAQEKGVLDEFKKANLESRKALLDEKVKAGVITQEQANTILENMENCDGSLGQKRLGQGSHMQFGKGSGNGMGKGNKGGLGRGMNRN